MKITGFKMLKDGIAGIEVEGIDLVDTGASRVMFKDQVKRKRNFPMPQGLRWAVQMLNYPFLVGTEYWRQEYAAFMKADYSGPARKDEFINNPVFNELIKLWESVHIQQCTIQKEIYKISAEMHHDMSTVKATVNVTPGEDHSLYSFVDEALADIVKMIDQNLSLPQTALGAAADIREIVQRISKDDSEMIADNATEEDAYLSMLKTASKHGYGLVMDDHMLSQLSAHIEEEEQADDVTFKIDDADVVSEETKDPSIFNQTAEEEII